MRPILLLSIIPILISSTALGRDSRWLALVRRNAEALYPAETMDSLLAAEQELPTAARIGKWARRFAAADDSRYLFGLDSGGYVSEGKIVDDIALDCVSLGYRVTELARAADWKDALRIALATRFAGAPPDSVIDELGRVDYDRPEHLDYSLDMIRSGLWGRDITRSLGGAAPDGVGSSRYPADSFFFLPRGDLVESELEEGDIAWLVLNPYDEAARKLRMDHGLVIGHIGIIIIEDGRPWLVHAASSPLKGSYDGGRVVMVPLSEYLSRVDRFYGVMITRFD